MNVKNVIVAGLLVGVAGCSLLKSQNSDSSANTGVNNNMTATAAASSSDIPTTKPAQESTVDYAKDLIKKGEALLAKGKSDNDPTEESNGQKLIDEGKALLQKAGLFQSK